MAAALPHVAILLCTYNGEKFLGEQLSSFQSQSHTNWSLWVNDDGSSDQTTAILADFSVSASPHPVSLANGPKQGYQRNFLELTARVPEMEYYAYADQDDIWERDHLERALAWLKTIPAHRPALYGARTLYVTAENQPLYPSQNFTKPPSFANALMQSIAGANTMVMNRAARDLIAKHAQLPVVGHDWWAYMLISGVGGAVYYDPIPALRYRQHGGNLLGQNRSLRAKLARIQGLVSGQFKEWNDINLRALAQVRAQLTPQNRQLLERYAAARQRGLLRRCWGLWRAGVHRQTLLGNLGLAAAAVMGRI